MTASRKIKALAALGTLSAGVWASTYATFSDDATAESTFTTGSVDLTVGGDADDDYAFAALESGNLKPGDVVYAPLAVANAGSLGFAYTMSSSSTNARTRRRARSVITRIGRALAGPAMSPGSANRWRMVPFDGARTRVRASSAFASPSRAWAALYSGRPPSGVRGPPWVAAIASSAVSARSPMNSSMTGRREYSCPRACPTLKFIPRACHPGITAAAGLFCTTSS